MFLIINISDFNYFIHNVHFIVNLVKKIRESIFEDRFEEFKKEFLEIYK